MSATDDHLEALYREAVRIRDDWFAAYVANLNRMAKELGSAQQFVTDFGHLVPRPMASHAPPPPLPETTQPEMTEAKREQYRRWQEAVGRYDDEPIGLDGIPGGMR